MKRGSFALKNKNSEMKRRLVTAIWAQTIFSHSTRPAGYFKSHYEYLSKSADQKTITPMDGVCHHAWRAEGEGRDGDTTGLAGCFESEIHAHNGRWSLCVASGLPTNHNHLPLCTCISFSKHPASPGSGRFPVSPFSTPAMVTNTVYLGLSPAPNS